MTNLSQSDTIHPYGDVDVNQVWEHKRESRRRVEITGLFVAGDGAYATVHRNTSRRRQAIKLPTLRRDYRRIK